MKKVDVIVPCYNESEVLGIFYEAIINVANELDKYRFNFIFVDDGSTDDTLELLKKFARDNFYVRYISFSRNFGKEAAMYAGLKNSTGDYAVIMDADMQHPPTLIKEMLEAVESGYDCCGALRMTRAGDPPLRTFFSRGFYRLANKISDVDMPDGAGDFRLMNRRMINAVLAMGEVQRFSKGIFSWVGFKTKWIEFEDVERAAGTTKWNFFKLFAYAIEGVTAFSVMPLRIASFFGSAISFFAFIYLVYIITKTLVLGPDEPGYASLMAIMLFIGGIIITVGGILGEYIGKIYMEVKNRPIYIIRESNYNDEKNDYK